jgi:nitrate reductase (NAD(P)H)
MQEANQDILKPSFSGVRVLPSANAVAKPRTSEVLMTKPGVRRMISMAEPWTQDKSNPWFVVKGEVYNGTGFLDEHPGGAESIFISAGEDVTDDFMAIHSPEGKLKLAAVSTQSFSTHIFAHRCANQFHIGTLDVDSIGPLSRIARSLSRSRSRSRSRVRTLPQVDEGFLHRTQWKTARLSKITPASHDSFVFRFDLEHPNQPLGLPVGQHVFVRLRRKTTGELVQRAYTPVSK